MIKIEQKLKELVEKKEGVLVVGTVPGYPDLETSFEIVKKIIESRADILELSSSFSDPIADGPTLTHAHQVVLNSGTTKKQIFDFYKKITDNFDIPIFVIEYANVVYKIGLNKYFQSLKKSGVESLIIPDIPLEEFELFSGSAQKNGVNLALIITPTSSNYRIKSIAEKSKSFVYCVLISGVTGARESISDETIRFIKQARKLSKLPLIAGFGISKPEHIKDLLNLGVNGFIVCSKIIDIINKNFNNKKAMLNELGFYIKKMERATEN